MNSSTSALAVANNKILLLGTGGTIAGVAPEPETASGVYQPGQLTVGALVPADVEAWLLQQGCALQVEQLFNLGSEDITPQHWLQLAQRVLSAAQDPTLCGIVITHGTDTLEETAWFLHLTTALVQPIVLTAAMRPANVDDADGPCNLRQALQVACDMQARQRGVLVCMQGQVRSAKYVRKQHTQALNAFSVPLLARSAVQDDPLGWFEQGVLRWADVLATDQSQLDVAEHAMRAPLFAIQSLLDKGVDEGVDKGMDTATVLPEVVILYGYAGVQPMLVDAVLQQKNQQTQGIIYAAVGNGTLSAPMRDALHKAAQQGCVVVRASRVPEGAVSAATAVAEDAQWLLSAGSLSPQQARILLILLLACVPAKARSIAVLQEYFQRW